MKVFTRNNAVRLGDKWFHHTISYEYEPTMDWDEFYEKNEEQITEGLTQAILEDGFLDDDLPDEFEKRLGDYVVDAMEDSKTAYESDDWGYRVPEGDEYEMMTKQGNARDHLKQERQRHLYHHKLA